MSISYEIYITDEDIAGLPEVNAEVELQAQKFAMKWRSAMSSHSRTGRFVASIRVERANDKDYWVLADVPYAFAVEYGHHGFVPKWDEETGERRMEYIGWVDGIGVLRWLL
mgnify:CR=1 FL=1